LFGAGQQRIDVMLRSETVVGHVESESGSGELVVIVP
jgi:hypothetical protein